MIIYFYYIVFHLISLRVYAYAFSSFATLVFVLYAFIGCTLPAGQPSYDAGIYYHEHIDIIYSTSPYIIHIKSTDMLVYQLKSCATFH